MLQASVSFPLASLLILCAVAARAVTPDKVIPLEIGQPAPHFELPGVDGKAHRLEDFDDAPVLVLVFTANHCPTAQAYEERLLKLHRDYRKRGVALVAISGNDPLAVRLDELGYTDVGDSLEDMKSRAKLRQFEFPYLYDGETQKMTRTCGALATPHVFIFDEHRKLRYQGRIDDSDVGTVRSHDTRNAIDALLAGKPVPVERTRVFGCSTKWAEKRATVGASLKLWDKETAELRPIDDHGVKILAQNNTDDLLLVNVWATWCGPCVYELEHLVTIHRMCRKRRFKVVTISMDSTHDEDRALAMLREKHASTTNYRFTSEERDLLAEALDKQWQGPLPYTVLIAPGGEVVYRVNGPFDPATLKREIVDRLGRTYVHR